MKEEMQVTNERYRLGYHLMTKGGWMNDPNGLSYFKGVQQESHDHIRIDAVMAFGFDMVISAVLPHLSSFRRGHWPQCGPLWS